MPSLADNELCPDCGAIIPPDAPGGNCLRCLFIDPPNAESLSSFPDEGELRGDDSLGMIGPYRLLERLGEGGFGEVFLAEQQRPVQRQVAIKVIKPGMDTRQVIARFEAERQALALMDHPFITRVLDAGESEKGRPYFVMEVVRGDALTHYCAKNELPLEERLSLFLQVCDAVHDAHRKGIIHRDLKPSNIVVTTSGEQAAPKVIDFGIAKATQHTLTASTLYTAPQQMIGTPEYMSPEQAVGRLDIDTRTDVYSLGMVLYELLGAGIPFRREDYPGGPDDLITAICEDLPPPPSSLKGALVEAGDLDLIALKAIGKERERRYDSVAALGNDISRYLAHEPIEARPLTVRYRLGRFVRKNRTTVIGGAVAILALLVGTVVSLMMAIEANTSRRSSEEARAIADEARLESQQTFSRSDLVRAGEALRVGEADAAAALLCRAIRSDPENVVASIKLLSVLENESFAIPVHALRHGHYVFRVAFSPDGRFLVSGSEDRVATIWSVETGERVVPPLKHRSRVKGLAISADSKLLATGDLSGELRIWELATGKLLAGPFRNQGEIVHCAFAEGGSRLLVATWGGWVTSWDWEQGSWSWRRHFHGSPIPAFALSENGMVLAAGSGDGSVRVWDAATGRLLFTPPIAQNGMIRDVALSRDGERLATACESGVAQIWDTRTGLPVTTELHHNGPVTAVDFSPDARFLASASDDRTARLWDAVTGEPMFPPITHSRGVTDVQISPMSDRIATSGHDGLIRIWDMRSGKSLAPPMRHGNWIEQIAFSPNGALIAAACRDDTAMLWDVRPRAAQRMRLAAPGRLREAMFHADGQRVLARSDSAPYVTAHEVGSGEKLDYEPLRGESATVVGINPKGPSVVAGLRSGEVLLVSGWGAERMALRGTTQALPTALALDQAGEYLAAGFADGMVETWHLSPGERPLRKEVMQTGLGGIVRVAIATGGRSVAARNREGRGWGSWESGENAVMDKSARMHSLVFADDGRHLASGGSDGTVRVWETETGALAFPALEHPYNRFLESPLPLFINDSRRLLTTRWEDNTLREWDLAGGGGPLGVYQSKYFVRFAKEDPSRRFVAVGCDDGTPHLLDLESGEWLASFPGSHRSMVTALDFSPDGQMMLSGSLDGAINLWPLPILKRSVPSWLLTLIETFLDRAPDAHRHRTRSSPLDLAGLRASIPPGSADYFSSWARWFFADPSDRPISPRSDHEMDGQSHVARKVEPRVRLPAEEPSALDRIAELRQAENRSVEEIVERLAVAAELARDVNHPGLRRAIHWQRAEFLRGLGERSKSMPDLVSALGISERDPETPLRCVDLTAHYNTSLQESWDDPYSLHGAWRLDQLPRGLQEFNGVPFDVRGMVQIVSEDPGWKNAYKDLYPQSIALEIGRPCRRIHLLYSCIIKLPEAAYGRSVGVVELITPDGRRQQRTLRYGVDLLDWRVNERELRHIERTESLRLAWQGERPGDVSPARPGYPHLCLFQTTIAPDDPDLTIKRIEMKAGKLKTSPFLVGVTIDEGDE